MVSSLMTQISAFYVSFNFGENGKSVQGIYKTRERLSESVVTRQGVDIDKGHR